MKIITIPLNDDNYGYLIIHEDTRSAALVDISSQPEECKRVAAEHGVNIVMVLTTHKHWDHAGGNSAFRETNPVDILGSARDNVEGCTRVVSDGDEVMLCDISIRCILTPGHTMGHISYYVQHFGQRAVFTGDTLFVGGCGKFFEGTAEDMYGSLQKLAQLPPDTQVFCGHEYTLSNYRFALSVDCHNQDLIEANESAKQKRDRNEHTVPSTIGLELCTNPFMRVDEPSISAMFSDCPSAVSVLSALREAKNNFK